MAKKEVEVLEEEVSLEKPLPVAEEFGRDDLNALAKAVNYLLARD